MAETRTLREDQAKAQRALSEQRVTPRPEQLAKREIPYLVSSRLALFPLVLALLPAIYLFLAIQYAGVTYPFWDHTDLLRSLAPLYDGHFRISSLWAPHNHSRPLTVRLIYLANARLTGWDIRSEFVFMYLAIYGTFALQMAILWHLTRRRFTLSVGIAALLISLVYFSPAGHMNQWWSMMLQLDLAGLLIVYALWSVSRNSASWTNSIAAAAAAWLATYTLTNGLIAMVVAAVLVQLSRPRPEVPDSRTLFWAANVIAVFVLYFHSLPSERVPRPGPIELIRFTLIYIGSPLADLLHFPFHGPFDVPTSTTFHEMCGLLLLLITGALCLRARRAIRAGVPSALVLLGFALFAVGSGVATGWDRARFDASGVALANTSRYTIFASFLLYGLIYFGASAAASSNWPAPLGRVRRLVPVRGAAGPLLVVIAAMALAGVSYGQGVRVYRAVHQWNYALGRAYELTPSARQFDPWIYGVTARSEEIRADLLRLHLGPYREVQTADLATPPDRSSAAGWMQLNRGTRLYQKFTAEQDRLVMLSIPVRAAKGGILAWTIFRLGPHGRTVVGSSSVSLDGAGTRGTAALVLGDLGATAGAKFALLLERRDSSPARIEFPLFARGRDLAPMLVNGHKRRQLTLSVITSYLVG